MDSKRIAVCLRWVPAPDGKALINYGDVYKYGAGRSREPPGRKSTRAERRRLVTSVDQTYTAQFWHKADIIRAPELTAPNVVYAVSCGPPATLFAAFPAALAYALRLRACRQTDNDTIMIEPTRVRGR